MAFPITSTAFAVRPYDASCAGSAITSGAFRLGDSVKRTELEGEIGFSRWLRADVTSGIVAPGASREIVLTYDAADLAVGDYDAEIVVASNDPASPAITLPVALTVSLDRPPLAEAGGLGAMVLGWLTGDTNLLALGAAVALALLFVSRPSRLQSEI